MKYGYSYIQGKKEVKIFLKSFLYPGDKICDIGAGSGTYYYLLGSDYEWTGVDIWHDSIVYLQDKYDFLYEEDIRTFKYPKTYNLTIFGDIIEHLCVEDAQFCIKNAQRHSKNILIAVPYQLEQDPLYGNEAERHLQSDLTPEIFRQRYPDFKLIHEVPNLYGYYHWRSE